MKKQDLEKAKIYDFKTKKQVADLPGEVTPPKSDAYTVQYKEKKPGQVVGHILPKGSPAPQPKRMSKKEMVKFDANGQWKIEKNVNGSYAGEQNSLNMSEKEMRSEVGDNREHDVRVKKTDPPQIFDNLKSSENAFKSEKVKFSKAGQWALEKSAFKHTDTHAGHDIHIAQEGDKFSHQLVRHGKGVVPGSASGPIFDSKEKAVTGAKVKINAGVNKAEKNPDKKEDADLGEKVEKLVEDHAEENKEAERKEGHKLLGKAEEEEYIHGLPKSHPALGRYKGYTYRRTRPPVKGDNRWQYAVRSPEGKDFKVHLPSESAGFAKDLHAHLDKLK